MWCHRRKSIYASIGRERANWHHTCRQRDETCKWIAVDRAVIDAQNTSLRVEEGIWSWIRGTLDDIFSEDDIASRRLDDSLDHVGIEIGRLNWNIWSRLLLLRVVV